MALDDFMTGLNALTAGVQQFQRSRAIQDANKLVADIRSQELDEFDKNMKLGEVVQGLQFRMMELGSNPSEAAGLTKMLMPQSSNQFYQSVDQALLNAKPGSPVYKKAAQLYQSEMDFRKFKELETSRRSEAKQEATRSRFETKETRGLISDFNKEPGVKELKQDLSVIDKSMPILEGVEARLAGAENIDGIDISQAERTTITQTTAILARLATDQRLSDQLIQDSALTQTWFNKLQKTAKALVSENPTNREVQVGLQLLRQYQSAINQALDKRSMQFTASALPTVQSLGLDPVEFRSTIKGNIGIGAEGLTEEQREALQAPEAIRAPSPATQSGQRRSNAQGRFRLNLTPVGQPGE